MQSALKQRCLLASAAPRWQPSNLSGVPARPSAGQGRPLWTAPAAARSKGRAGGSSSPRATAGSGSGGASSEARRSVRLELILSPSQQLEIVSAGLPPLTITCTEIGAQPSPQPRGVPDSAAAPDSQPRAAGPETRLAVVAQGGTLQLGSQPVALLALALALLRDSPAELAGKEAQPAQLAQQSEQRCQQAQQAQLAPRSKQAQTAQLAQLAGQAEEAQQAQQGGCLLGRETADPADAPGLQHPRHRLLLLVPLCTAALLGRLLLLLARARLPVWAATLAASERGGGLQLCLLLSLACHSLELILLGTAALTVWATLISCTLALLPPLSSVPPFAAGRLCQCVSPDASADFRALRCSATGLLPSPLLE